MIKINIIKCYHIRGAYQILDCSFAYFNNQRRDGITYDYVYCKSQVGPCDIKVIVEKMDSQGRLQYKTEHSINSIDDYALAQKLPKYLYDNFCENT